jgi:hypothetical protein
MIPTHPRALEIEAYAWATLCGPDRGLSLGGQALHGMIRAPVSESPARAILRWARVWTRVTAVALHRPHVS